MPSLERQLRKELERTVKQARAVAEAGAVKAIERLGVGDAEPPTGLNPAAKSLRNRLRAHGRQLGDRRDAKKRQETYHLIAEFAYEHWHRMLFARFLAENNLLIEPTHNVPISLDDCKELAREQKKDWLTLASEFAVRMLPQIFRPGDPVLDVSLPPEDRSRLEDLMRDLPHETFLADDSLGWVYQFWQTDEKDRVNKSEEKIGADELPAVTQLFTEDYMVLFLLHNTLGAWWAGKQMQIADCRLQIESEVDARRAVALPGIHWEYLRFIENAATDAESESSSGDSGSTGLRSEVCNLQSNWRPAAGAFPGWPKAAKDLTVLDPCMGSGHFLVFALPILVAMRMAEEGLSRESAVEAVLRDNLFGLEIDPRCTQIAAFNLALAAWKIAGYRQLPQLNLACSGLGPSATEEEWLKLADKRGMDRKTKVLADDLIKESLRNMHQTFSQAPTLGSLIDPRQSGEGGFTVDFDTLRPYLKAALTSEGDEEEQERVVAAQGMVKAAELLAGEYTLVITNVPYLGRGKQDDVLKQYLGDYYPAGKADLATAFVQRCLEYCAVGGTTALVTPQNWLFLTSYTALRKTLLKEDEWNLVARLGEHAFESSAAAGAFASIQLISAAIPSDEHVMAGIDVSAPRGQPPIYADEKAARLRGDQPAEIAVVKQAEQLGNPDARITFEHQDKTPLLKECADSYWGQGTGDFPRFGRFHWEVARLRPTWARMQGTPDTTRNFDGRSMIVLWEEQGPTLFEIAKELRRIEGHSGIRPTRGDEAWSKDGVCVALMSTLPVTRYTGEIYDGNCAALIPKSLELLPAIWAFCSTAEFTEAIRRIDRKVNVVNHTLIKVPFDLAHWQKVAAEKYPNGLPDPESDDPTQWLFHGRPEASTVPLQVAVARLVGYRWPAEYENEMRLSQRARDLVARCQELDSHVDDDGIVCLTPVKGEAPAAERVNALLAAAYGKDWNAGKLASLLAEAGFANKSLNDWLRDGFFEQHCALFHIRPFVWHVWDGRTDGFHALVNYHRLAGPKDDGKRTLEKLIYSYLGDWIDRQRADQKAGVEGSDARLAAAEHLKAELEKILAGEPPYDIFVRWKPIHEQPIGWEPDINDGVRLNIRPFMTAKPMTARGKTACILRVTPKGIKWDKDRGKEPKREKADYPWFWSWNEETEDFTGGKDFDGNRWNDLHYSNEMKQAARSTAAKRGEKK